MTDVPLSKRRAVQVAHSLNVIAELPRYVNDAALPVGLRVAAIDAFFIHLRLLIEFLIKKPNRDHPAIHRDDYASGFNLGSVDSALYRRLSTDFDFASQHVAHFSLNRLPTEESAGVDYMDAARLRSRAEDVFGAMEAFIRYMHANPGAYADDFERRLSDAKARRTEAWCLPVFQELHRLNYSPQDHDLRLESLEEKVAPHYGTANIVDAGVVVSGVLAECLERVIEGGLSLGSEHAFGLLDNEPGVQRLLQLFGGALLLLCSRSVGEVASCDAGEDRGDSQILG